MIKWVVAVVATEGMVEILMHSELFGWLRRAGKPTSCAWCLSVWIGTIASVLVVVGAWPVLLPIAVARASNVLHEIHGALRR